MQIQPVAQQSSNPDFASLGKSQQAAQNLHTATAESSDELKQAFQDFVGQTMFSQMIKSMRSTQQPSAYFNGGRAEEIFQGQLDQVLSEEMSKSSAEKFADPMFELFMLRRQA